MAVLTVSGPDTLARALCIVVLLLMAVAVVYAAWIAVSNYSQIAV
jgi:hypothetical protein